MRNIKTGIAVFLATLAGYLGIVETPIYTVSVCIFSMKNTIKNTIDNSFSRIFGTLLGGVVGYICATIFPSNIITATLGVVVIIHLCNEMKIYESSAYASVTFIAICLGINEHDPLVYSIMRTIDTLVGVIIALLVNLTVSRHKYIKYLLDSFYSNCDQFINIINKMLDDMDFSLSYKDLHDTYEHINSVYTQLIDELPLSIDIYNLNTLHVTFDRCDLLVHHIYGLYIIEKQASYSTEYLNKSVYKYHIENILKVLDEHKNNSG